MFEPMWHMHKWNVCPFTLKNVELEGFRVVYLSIICKFSSAIKTQSGQIGIVFSFPTINGIVTQQKRQLTTHFLEYCEYYVTSVCCPSLPKVISFTNERNGYPTHREIFTKSCCAAAFWNSNSIIIARFTIHTILLTYTLHFADQTETVSRKIVEAWNSSRVYQACMKNHCSDSGFPHDLYFLSFQQILE